MWQNLPIGPLGLNLHCLSWQSIKVCGFVLHLLTTFHKNKRTYGAKAQAWGHFDT